MVLRTHFDLDGMNRVCGLAYWWYGNGDECYETNSEGKGIYLVCKARGICTRSRKKIEEPCDWGIKGLTKRGAITKITRYMRNNGLLKS